MAQRRLEILSRRKKKVEKLEWDRDALVEFYAEIVSEALDRLSPEERHHVYMIVRLRVEPAPDGSIDVSGTLTRRTPGFWFPRQHPKMKENINDPKLAESACESGDPEQVEPCIDGLASLYTSHYGSAESTRELCAHLEDSNQRACYGSVESYSKRFSS